LNVDFSVNTGEASNEVILKDTDYALVLLITQIDDRKFTINDVRERYGAHKVLPVA
jgi:hypothetical protein